MIIECPDCRKEFEAKVWVDSSCPDCNKSFYWDSYFDCATDDEELVVDWN